MHVARFSSFSQPNLQPFRAVGYLAQTVEPGQDGFRPGVSLSQPQQTFGQGNGFLIAILSILVGALGMLQLQQCDPQTIENFGDRFESGGSNNNDDPTMHAGVTSSGSVFSLMDNDDEDEPPEGGEDTRPRVTVSGRGVNRRQRAIEPPPAPNTTAAPASSETAPSGGGSSVFNARQIEVINSTTRSIFNGSGQTHYQDVAMAILEAAANKERQFKAPKGTTSYAIQQILKHYDEYKSALKQAGVDENIWLFYVCSNEGQGPTEEILRGLNPRLPIDRKNRIIFNVGDTVIYCPAALKD